MKTNNNLLIRLHIFNIAESNYKKLEIYVIITNDFIGESTIIKTVVCLYIYLYIYIFRVTLSVISTGEN